MPKPDHPHKCLLCGEPLRVRYRGSAEKIFEINPSGTLGELVEETIEIDTDDPLYYCRDLKCEVEFKIKKRGERKSG